MPSEKLEVKCFMCKEELARHAITPLGIDGWCDTHGAILIDTEDYIIENGKVKVINPW